MNKVKSLDYKSRLASRFVPVLVLLTLVSLDVREAFTQKKNGEVDAAEAVRKYHFEIDKRWSFGWENYKNKQYESAIKHFSQLVKVDTINRRTPKVWKYFGDAFLKINRPDSAQIIFELGSARHPEEVHLHRMVGFLLTQREMVDEAIERYEIVVEKEPESMGDLQMILNLYQKADRIEDAIKICDRILAINSDDMEVQQIKKGLYGLLGDPEAVRAEMEKIREKDPQDAQVRYELAQMYYRDEEDEKTVEVLAELLQLTPNDTQARRLLANSHKRAEQYNDAIGELSKILEIEPENKEIVAEISRGYKQLGQLRKARSFALKTIGMDNSFGLGWIVLGEAYEASAEKCADGNNGAIKFDDKLVYELAYQKYRRAARDPAWQSDANRQISYVKAVLPLKADIFMHRSTKRPAAACYSWIPESEFSQGYWNALNRRIGN